MPIKVKHVQYFEDRIIEKIYEAQNLFFSLKEGDLERVDEGQDKKSEKPSQRIALQKQISCVYERIHKLKTMLSDEKADKKPLNVKSNDVDNLCFKANSLFKKVNLTK